MADNKKKKRTKIMIEYFLNAYYFSLPPPSHTHTCTRTLMRTNMKIKAAQSVIF